MVDFVKLHGTGNDFVVIPDLDNKIEVSAEAAQLLSTPHFGVGADGVIRIGRSSNSEAAFFMDYRNADGSVAEMCGNGVRVVGKWLGDHGHARDEVALDTLSGVKHLLLTRAPDGKVEQVTVDMGPPLQEPLVEVLQTEDGAVDATIISMGNPHAVVFVEDVDAVDVDRLGYEIEHNPRFVEGTNVEFVDNLGHSLRQRTWERGVGETLGCGTGACAVIVAAINDGRAPAGVTLPIALRGGLLRLEWTPGSNVKMSGPASEVFTGSLDPNRYGIKVNA